MGQTIVEMLVPKADRKRYWTKQAATRWAASYLSPMIDAKLVEPVVASRPQSYRITDAGREELRGRLL